MALRLLRALPGVSGLLASVAREIVHELDPSVEGSQRPLSEVRPALQRPLFANLGKQRALAKYQFECRFRFEVPVRTRGKHFRNFKSAALVPHGLTVRIAPHVLRRNAPIASRAND